MRYVLLFLSVIALNISCQNQPVEKKQTAEIPAFPSDTDGSLCFQKKMEDSNMSLQFVVEEYSLTGTLVLRSEQGQPVSAKLTGKEIQGEFITDVHYVLDEKIYDEKIILSYDDRSASIARSGKIVVNGERVDRNGGMGSLDVLNKVPCVN